MEQRLDFLREYETGLFTMSELATQYGISRKTAYKWVERYEAEGTGRPLATPASQPAGHRARAGGRVDPQRLRHPRWGAKKVAGLICYRCFRPRARLLHYGSLRHSADCPQNGADYHTRARTCQRRLPGTRPLTRPPGPHRDMCSSQVREPLSLGRATYPGCPIGHWQRRTIGSISQGKSADYNDPSPTLPRDPQRHRCP
jgi:hypothetical protein